MRRHGTYTDQYELSMAEVYFKSGRIEDKVVFDYFFRKLPFGSGYAIFAGLQDLIETLENFRFSEDELAFLREQKHDQAFLDFLRNFQFKGNIHSCAEGEVVFGLEPILRVEGTIIETQLIETLLLNLLNFQSLIATKASRIRHVAPSSTLLEFGLRRAQGTGGHDASRAAIIGGFDSTSFVLAAKNMGLNPSGTMAHSFIQSETSELTAFRKFVEHRPHDCVLLLDTYSTLESGLPHAIIVAKEMEKKGHRLRGVRLDSGDLAYLSVACRKALDEAGLHYVKIVASNQLDEFVIESLVQQDAPIDVFGVGTKLVTGHPDGALDGVYKLSEINGDPRIKLSENVSKISLPHKKQIYRTIDKDGQFLGIDVIGLEDEKEIRLVFHPTDPLSTVDVMGHLQVPLLKLQMEDGKRIGPRVPMNEIKAFVKERLKLLPPEYKRFTNPHAYKVGLTGKLKDIRDNLVKEHKVKRP